MKIPTIADVMKRQCEFRRYEDGKLWYSVRWTAPDVQPVGLATQTFEFPVPIEDAGAGAFEPEMKAINLLRWIRKHIEFLTEARKCDDCGRDDGHDADCFYHGPY